MVEYTIHDGSEADPDCCPSINGTHQHGRSRFILGQLGWPCRRAPATFDPAPCIGNCRLTITFDRLRSCR
ncbi:MAG: hypothetical protein CMJ41_10340 [Phycisphaerae bacterium]|nr:hypothetical protein [Phycisphaerae bacterium]